MMFVLLMPLLQYQLNIFEVNKLKGAITLLQDTIPTRQSWWDGRFQQKKEKYFNEKFGFRNEFVQFNNQLAYWLFNVAKAYEVIIGKDNYLIEKKYIDAYYGDDFIGDDSIKRVMQRVKAINDTLVKRGKSLILIFAPSKVAFFPEYIPDKFCHPRGKTNINYYRKYAKAFSLNYLDFNQWFLDKKGKTKYPLYPQYGIHWSAYGGCIANDSLIRFIEKLRGIDMPDFKIRTVKMRPPESSDIDIGDGMNLFFLPHTFPMPYPEITIENHEGKTRPSLLTISDSYYWLMYANNISNCFSSSHFWFYNREVFPESFTKPLKVSSLNYKEEIEKNDIIILMATESTLSNFGWGFIERYYNIISGIKEPDWADNKKLEEAKRSIRGNAKWMEQIVIKAEKLGISIDSMVTNDAYWVLQNQR